VPADPQLLRHSPVVPLVAAPDDVEDRHCRRLPSLQFGEPPHDVIEALHLEVHGHEKKDRRRIVDTERPPDRGPVSFPVDPGEARNVRSRRKDEHAGLLDAVLADEFFLCDRRDGEEPPAAGIRHEAGLHPAGGPVEKAHALPSHVAYPEPMGDAVHGEEIRLANPVVGVDEVGALPRDGAVCEPGKARGDEGAGKPDDRDAVKRDARHGPAPTVGEDMDIEAGVCRRPGRQLCREILSAAHEAEPGDHDGDFFPFLHQSARTAG